MHCLYTKVVQNYFPFEQLSALVYTSKMGRGRKGPMEQSFKKPKGLEYYGEDLTLFLPHIKKEKPTPTLLSEDVIAEMKKMSPQNLMNILLPNKNVNRESKQVYMPKMVGISNNCQLSGGIQKLTQELCKEINKENLNKRLSQRKALGWDKVNEAITKAPFANIINKL